MHPLFASSADIISASSSSTLLSLSSSIHSSILASSALRKPSPTWTNSRSVRRAGTPIRQRRRRRPAAFAFLRGRPDLSQNKDEGNDDKDENPTYPFLDSSYGDNTPTLHPPLSTIHRRILSLVGDPVTRPTDSTNFPTRTDIQISSTYPLHVDLGGEGRFTTHGVTAGFGNALNINARWTNSQLIGVPIPNLIPVVGWKHNPPIPLADGVVDYVTMQSAPLTEHNVNEICRVLAKGGCVGLWIDLDTPVVTGGSRSTASCTNLDMVHCLAERLKSEVTYCCSGADDDSKGGQCLYGDCDEDGCWDEFEGRYPFAKCCIVDRRS